MQTGIWLSAKFKTRVGWTKPPMCPKGRGSTGYFIDSASGRATSSLEQEVREHRRRVAQYNTSAGLLSTAPSPRSPETFAQLPAVTFGTPQQQPTARPSARTAVSHSSIEGVRAPGVTTRPIIDHDQTCSIPLVVAPQPRKLADIELSLADIEELFQRWVFSPYEAYIADIRAAISATITHSSRF